GRLYSSLASATITGVIAAVIGVPLCQKVEVTIAAVSEARLATIRVCSDRVEPPPLSWRLPDIAVEGSETYFLTFTCSTFDPAPWWSASPAHWATKIVKRLSFHTVVKVPFEATCTTL